ncbi:MAG TPA: tetratricopeptide repeat-containing protein kinase family protein, partial [Kofleriaceae bacterium]|nr:tetratricopeptide repeat-containing protein kinase family protein [Kofleriaceae bacterium]
MLYEALAGKRPFEGRSISELRDAIARGPAPATVPAWIQRILSRGLAADPARRFENMNELLAALARDPARRRRRFAVGAALVAVGGALAFLVSPHRDPCRETHLASWTAADREHVRTAFAATKRPFTEQTLAYAVSGLDAYAAQWSLLRRESCQATYEDRGQSDSRYDAQLACFERSRREVAAVVDVLAHADEQTVRNAHALVAGLPDLDVCRHTSTAQAPMPSKDRPAIEAAYRDLATARALAKASKYPSAQKQVEAVIAKARPLGYAPLLAEALYIHGKLQMFTHDAATAEKDLTEAASLAATAKDDELAAHIYIQLAYTVGALAQRFPEAAQLLKVAETSMLRASSPPDVHMDHADAAAAIAAERGDIGAALAEIASAVGLASDNDRPAQLAKQAALLDAAGRYPEARKASEQAIALYEQQLGPDHPDLAFALDALGAIEYDAGQFSESQATYARALAILDKLGDGATYST